MLVRFTRMIEADVPNGFSWAPMVAERLFSWSSPPRGSAYAGSSEAMEDIDSTDVTYKIRQWSLRATIVPVLNVSSRVFWLELDDKALLDSYAVLQEGILCDVFS